MAQGLRSPDIAELRAFCAAADLGSLGRAAVQLRISQPAVSKRLRSLETLAGAELLHRSPTGVSLTASGRRLYPEARKLLDQADAVEEMLAGLGGDLEPLRIAVSHTIAEHYLSAELVALESRAGRHRTVDVTASNSTGVREAVAEGRADIGVAAARLPGDREDGLEEMELIDDEVVLAVPTSHRWYRADSVTPDEFVREPLIVRDPGSHSQRLVDAVLASKRLQLATPLMQVGNTAAAKREALEHSAPLMLSALALDPGRDRLHRREIEGLRFPRRFLIVARSFADLRPADRAFAEFLRRRHLDVVPPADG
jgi:DNA-binding transcriptional LysR family regulator